MTDPVVDVGQPSPVVSSPVASNGEGNGVTVNNDGSTSATSGTGAAPTTEGNTSGTGEPAVAGTPATDPATATTNADGTPKKPITPEWAQKRINDLTARRYEAERLSQEAGARATAAEARAAELLKKLENPTGGNAADPAKPATIIPEEEIERRAKIKAAEMSAAAEFNRACDGIVNAGKKEFKDTWDETVKNLSLVGAVGPNANMEFLETAIELQNPHKILKYLGDNLEEAERIVKMAPKKMAMELARVEAAINAPPPPVVVAPVVPTPISNAPAPVIPAASGSARPGSVDLADSAVKMEDWFIQRQKDIETRRTRYNRA